MVDLERQLDDGEGHKAAGDGPKRRSSEAVKKHLAVIRNSLGMVLSCQDAGTLFSLRGKQRLHRGDASKKSTGLSPSLAATGGWKTSISRVT